MTSDLQAQRGVVAQLRVVSDLLKTELPLAAGLCVLAGEVLGLGRLPPLGLGVLGFLVGFCLSGSAMISNDAFDLEVDRVNHPERPLPSGRVSVREVAVLSGLFAAAGLLAAAFLGALALLLAAAIWALGLLYNAKLKETGLPGNLTVSLSVAGTFVFGGLAAGGLAGGLVWTFGGLAFLFDLGEEVASGVMDAEGDAVRHAKSIARVHGRRTALAVAGGFFGAFMALSLLPFSEGWMGSLPLLLILVADAAITFLFVRLVGTRTPQEGRRRIRQLYLAMVIVVAAFVIGVGL